MEDIKIFGENQGEIGSLDKNLVLRTKGQVYIRFGRKYIELLDSNGNLNIKIPKIIKKIKSNNEIKDDGFYILDESIYAYSNGELIQISGIEGQFISYAIEQKLSQKELDVAQKNLGIKFKSLFDAEKAVEEGIVFIGNKIYYINNGESSEIFNELLTSLNNSGLGIPNKDNYCIAWNKGKWIFQRFITQEDLDLLDIPEQQEINKETYECVEYSKYYRILESNLIIDSNNDRLVNGIQNIKTVPELSQTTNDIFTVTLELNIADNIDTFTNESISYVGLTYLRDNNGKEIKQVLLVDLKYNSTNNSLYFIDSTGTNFSVNYKKARAFQEISSYKTGNIRDFEQYKEGKEVSYFTINNINYVIKNIKSIFRDKYVYVKAEDSNSFKFKIDYQNTEIALEENYPQRAHNNNLNLNPHVVLGDLNDTQKYYNNPAISFKTYNDDLKTHGLFSDSNVFIGGEFRHPLPKYQSQNNNSLTPQDIYYYHFPRYSIDLTKGMTEPIFDHDEIILPKKWVPRAANYIEDLTSDSADLETKDISLYNGKLFLYKIDRLSNGSYISARFKLSPQYNKNGVRINNTYTSNYYFFYPNGNKAKEEDYETGTIILAQYNNGKIVILRDCTLVTIQSNGTTISTEPDFNTINFKGGTNVKFTVAQSDRTITIKVNTTTAFENRISTIENNISTMQTQISSLQGSVSSLQSSVSNLQSSVSSLQSSVSSLSSLSSTVSTLSNTTSTLSSTVSTLSGEVSTLQINLSSLEGRVTALEGAQNNNNNNDD